MRLLIVSCYSLFSCRLHCKNGSEVSWLEGKFWSWRTTVEIKPIPPNQSTSQFRLFRRRLLCVRYRRPVSRQMDPCCIVSTPFRRLYLRKRCCRLKTNDHQDDAGETCTCVQSADAAIPPSRAAASRQCCTSAVKNTRFRQAPVSIMPERVPRCQTLRWLEADFWFIWFPLHGGCTDLNVIFIYDMVRLIFVCFSLVLC